MKQLMIFCSRDLEDRVIGVLDQAGIDGFFRTGAATGNKFVPGGRVPRTQSWEAAMFVVPAVAAEKIDSILGALAEYARSCEIEPCLRVIVSSVEAVQ
jgi:hypothetical protein